MKQFFGRKSRSMLATVIMVSLLLHIVAILVFGTIKFVEALREEETVFEAAQIVPPPQKEPEYTVNIQQRNKSTPPPRPPAIVVNNPSELDIPALDIDVNVDSSAVYGRGGGGFGGGLAGVREMAITADLFGVSVTAENLGVVLDISGSAHAYLIQAIEEIDRNFPKAHMVLVVGCGMSDGTGAINGGGGKVPGKPRVVPYNQRGSNEQYDHLERSVAGQLEKFFRMVGKDRADEFRRYFKRRDNLFMLYGGDIHATNFAFYELLDNKNTDTIYWFADFRDGCKQPIVDDLAKRLRRNRCTLIAHNFHGKPVKPNIAEMIEKIGGKTIQVIPGQK